jgi:hypothetical protein
MKSLALVPLCLCVIAFAQPSISEDGVWKDFTIWLQGSRQIVNPVI